MSYTYTYTISTDFPTGGVNEKKLKKEIDDSSIASATLDAVEKNDGDSLDIIFSVQLSSGDKTTLDGDQQTPALGLIQNH